MPRSERRRRRVRVRRVRLGTGEAAASGRGPRGRSAGPRGRHSRARDEARKGRWSCASGDCRDAVGHQVAAVGALAVEGVEPPPAFGPRQERDGGREPGEKLKVDAGVDLFRRRIPREPRRQLDRHGPGETPSRCVNVLGGNQPEHVHDEPVLLKHQDVDAGPADAGRRRSARRRRRGRSTPAPKA